MLDDSLKFSEDQAITATATSTNIIDLGNKREVAFGNPVSLYIMIKESFNTLTSLTFTVKTSANSDMSSASELASCTVALANLTKGKRVPLAFFPCGNKRYAQLTYTVTGSNPSTGKISAYLADAVPQSYHDKIA